MDPHASGPLSRAGVAPEGARLGLVLVHGRGGSAPDILGLGTHLGFDDIAMIAPAATGNSWWPTSFLAEMSALEPYVTSGLSALDRAVAALEAGGLKRDQIAVGGFSQGACLALEWAARTGGPLAAVIGLSGGLVGTGDADGAPDPALYGHRPKRFDYDTRLEGIPVFLACHEADPHIPLARVRHSETVFRDRGAHLELEIYPGAGHGVMPSAIDTLRRLLG